MPIYNFSSPVDRLACIRDQPTRGRMQTIAEIVRRHYGDAAVEALREDYKKSRAPAGQPADVMADRPTEAARKILGRK